MKHYEVQDTATHYLVEVEQSLVGQEPVLLEREGQPIAVLLPMSAYEAFRAWQSSFTESLQPVDASEFKQEVLAFERLKPQLLAYYPGRVVAIYQGQVVAVGDNRLDVLDQVWDQFGEVSCYIENLEPQTPRRARIPSAWIRK